MAKFIIQTAIHGDYGSTHDTLEDALAGIEEMVRLGVAEPGEFNVRELDDQRRIVRVIAAEPTAGAA